MDEPRRVVGLMRLVASLHDGHTIIEPVGHRFAFWYPIRIYEFTDGYFVTSAHQSVADLAGARILKIAGRPVSEVADEARGLFGTDNDFDAKEKLYAIHNAFLMRGLGYAAGNGQLTITATLTDGSTVERTLTPHPADDRYPPTVPVFEWRFRSEVYGLPFGKRDEWRAAYHNLPSDAFEEPDPNRPAHLYQRVRYTKLAYPTRDAYYIQISQTDDSSMGPFFSSAMKEVDELKPRRLILDIRYNFGGDGSTVNGMIHEFIRRELSPPWHELYLVTGRKTFSAAMSIVDGLLENASISIVGEPPGAALNSFGDPTAIPYPALGLQLDVSTVEHQLSQSNDLSKYVAVDVPALMSFADYAAGNDPAVDAILDGAEMRSLPVIARMEGGDKARSVYLDRLERFGSLEWWSPPKEISLRAACDYLVAEERFEDALETCRLNTEIHPYVWNTWYNLAQAQKAAGLADNRLSSYQCVVKLAPNNWNVPGIQALFARLGVEPEIPPGCPVE